MFLYKVFSVYVNSSGNWKKPFSNVQKENYLTETCLLLVWFDLIMRFFTCCQLFKKEVHQLESTYLSALRKTKMLKLPITNHHKKLTKKIGFTIYLPICFCFENFKQFSIWKNLKFGIFALTFFLKEETRLKILSVFKSRICHTIWLSEVCRMSIILHFFQSLKWQQN